MAVSRGGDARARVLRPELARNAVRLAAGQDLDGSDQAPPLPVAPAAVPPSAMSAPLSMVSGMSAVPAFTIRA